MAQPSIYIIEHRIDSNLDNLKIRVFTLTNARFYFSNAIKLVPLAIGLWSQNKKKELAMLSPWGCKPFYSPRQARLTRKY
jgi:hypothetical protein